MGLGASAGGIEAFKSLLAALPDDTGMAFVFVLHLAPTHASMLAPILGRETRMPVMEVRDEPEVLPNHVYVIPPGRAMILRRGRLHLIPETERPRHPIDTFFGSLAEDRGHLAVGVVLSGTATDGTLGVTLIKAAGGITFAQDGSAQHDGMPRNAIGSGCVDFVLAPREIAVELTRLAHHPYVTLPAEPAAQPDKIEPILDLVRRQTSVDFTQYKSNTLHRRIRRRMALHKLSRIEQYAAYLAQRADEVEALYQDFLISVTHFFRNADAFEVLKAQVLPRVFKDRSRQDPVRAWVLGCSSGEEAYSLAIVLAEYIADTRSAVPVVLYATDLNNVSIERARAGLYPKSIADDVAPERLQRFFIEVESGYRVAQPIRDMCIFARQNVITDPPFSRMDLVSCRNLMIYLEPALQRRVLHTLHYALKPSGFLLLGPSETISSNRELFEPDDAKHKIFSRKAAAVRLDQAFPVAPPLPMPQDRRAERAAEMPRDAHGELQREADRVLLSRYVPAGVLVNGDFDVVQFRGETGLYLSPAPGKASLNLLKMAREGLLVSLRTLLLRAKKEDDTVQDADVRVKSNGGYLHVALSVVPVKRGASRERWYWVLFEEPRRAGGHDESGPAQAKRPARRARRSQDEISEKNDQIARLTQELAATREYLQSVIEQQEAANEELQSANEEVQSANEELQSINEELETSKEEIQSSNEELRTVNEELHERNEELSRLNEDLSNLLSSVDIAIVMVWHDLRIRRFTPLAEKHFNLIAADVGRPIGDITLNLKIPALPQLLADTIDAAAIKEMEVQDRHGRWYLLRIRPYRTLANKVDGAVIVLIDIHTLKTNREVLERQAQLLDQDAIFARDSGDAVRYWSRGAELLYGYTQAEALGRNKFELLGTSAASRRLIQQALAAHGRWHGELEHRTKAGRAIIVDSTQMIVREDGRTLVLETNHDVTERKQLEQALQQRVEELADADRRKNDFLALLAHELRNPLAPLRNAVHILKRTGLDGETGAQARGLIERQVGTLTRLVDDLLDAARINRGQVQLQLQTAELQSIVRGAVETMQPLIDAHRHRLSVRMPADPILLEADPTRLEQVFCNLLTNAARYTPDTGEIQVIVEPGVEREGRSWAVVRIRDTGVGIEPAMLTRIFDLFTQIDQPPGGKREGLGIGLSVVRNLVELHGGRVAASSEGAGRGAEFMVELPMSDPDAPGAGEEGAAASGAAGDERSGNSGETERGVEESSPSAINGRASMRVLVVDDNPDIAESVSVMLRLAGHTVASVLSGEAAIDLADSFEPAVVLLDIGMPGMDGYTVARRFRADPRLKSAVLIAVSGYGTAADRARTSEAGFDRHLVKPVDPGMLQRLIVELARSER